MNQSQKSNLNNLFLRFADERDINDIFRWRNDQAAVRYSLTGEVKYQEHIVWFKKKITDPNTQIFIINQNHDKIGMLRFDKEDDKNSSEVSININPKFRGMGYGKSGLIKAIKVYFRNFDVDGIKAIIKKENKVSIKLFEEIGFRKINEKDGIYCYFLRRNQTILL